MTVSPDPDFFDDFFDDEDPRPLGMVLEGGRGSLPFSLLHGESLVACAAWALGEAGVDIADASVPWSDLVEAGKDLVLHDALCPMTPPSFITACVERARETGAAVVGTRPVTDTVKRVAEGLVGETVDRESLVAIVSPVVIPAAMVAALPGRPTADLTRVVSDLAALGHRVETIPAPAEARRVSCVEDVRLLEALTAAKS